MNLFTASFAVRKTEHKFPYIILFVAIVVVVVVVLVFFFIPYISHTNDIQSWPSCEMYVYIHSLEKRVQREIK